MPSSEDPTPYTNRDEGVPRPESPLLGTEYSPDELLADGALYLQHAREILQERLAEHAARDTRHDTTAVLVEKFPLPPGVADWAKSQQLAEGTVKGGQAGRAGTDGGSAPPTSADRALPPADKVINYSRPLGSRVVPRDSAQSPDSHQQLPPPQQGKRRK